MKAKLVRGEFHWCGFCEEFFEQLCAEFEAVSLYDINSNSIYVNGDNYIKNEDLENLSSRTIYECENGCRTADDEMIYDESEGIWKCGECETLYQDQDSAEECCGG